MSMTQLEKVLAESLAKYTSGQIDVVKIIEAAQAAVIGGCQTTEATGTVIETAIGQVVVPPAAPKAPRTKKEVVEAPPPPKAEPPAAEPPPVKQEPVTQEPPKNETMPEKPAQTSGVNLTGLFTGSGADKKVVKDVFLAAVEQAKSLPALVALNATCDCGFALGDYTEDMVEVVRRKLRRWGMAQE